MRQEHFDLAELVAILSANPHCWHAEPLDCAYRATKALRQLLLGEPRLAMGFHGHEPFPLPAVRTSTRPTERPTAHRRHTCPSSTATIGAIHETTSRSLDCR